jgi:YbgC/YbaW family acyl-CoA thioester hydrolase
MTHFDAKALARGPARWSHPMQARFQDIDAAGIVFYPRFFEYFHDAYVAFLDGRGCELHRAIAERRWAAPLKHVEADYLRPLRFGDRFAVGLVGVVITGSDVDVGYQVARPDGEVVAVGRTVHVWVDAQRFRRLAALPEDVRAALDPLVVSERGAPT